MKIVKNTFVCLSFLLIFCLELSAEERFAAVPRDNIMKHEEKKRKVLDEYQKIDSSKAINRAELAAILGVELDLSFPQDKTQIIVDIGNNWAKDFIREITAKGIMEIYSNHNFIPERKITRAEFVYYIQEIIIRFKNDYTLRNKFMNLESPFMDLPKEHIYYNPVILAVTAGIMQGTSPDEFSPQGMVSGTLALTAIQRLRKYLESGNIK